MKVPRSYDFVRQRFVEGIVLCGEYSGAPYYIQIKHDEMTVRYLQCIIFGTF